MNLESLQRIQKQSAQRADNRNRKVVIRRGRKYVYHSPYKPVIGPLLRRFMPKIIANGIIHGDPGFPPQPRVSFKLEYAAKFMDDLK